MGAITTSLGGGTGDSANQTIAISPSADLVSNISPSSTSTYLSGGFDSIGNPYITRPIAISDVTVIVGKYGSANVGVRAMYKTSLTGSPLVNSTSTYFTGLLGPTDNLTVTTQSTYLYKTFVSTSGFYGIEAPFSGGAIEYANGGSVGFIANGATQISSTTKLSGSITQVSIPSAPGNPNALSITDTSANIIWSAPSDDGMQSPAAYSASNIKGYRINYRNSGSENWKVLVANTGSNLLYKVVTGLAPSTYYEIQIAALNAVTDSHNSNYSNITAHVGSRSITHPFTTLESTHNLRVYANNTYTKATIKIWDGSQWIGYPNIDIKVWDGNEFKETALEL